MNRPNVNLLKAARDVIANPDRWTQRQSARDENGRYIAVDSKRAVSWCSVGALAKVSDPEANVLGERSMLDAAADKLGSDGLVDFNDTHTHSEVLALWDSVIADLESQP